jgi:hypothetical protein
LLKNRFDFLNQLGVGTLDEQELARRLKLFLATTDKHLVERWQEDQVIHGTEAQAAEAVACYQAILDTWAGWTEHVNPSSEDLGWWPQQFEPLRSQVINQWAYLYRLREAQERLKANPRTDDDWRMKICKWVVVGARGPKPEISRWEIPCDVIPSWEEGRTFLTLLPAPYLNPPYLPAVVELPEAGSLLGGALRLKQRSALLEAEPLSLAFTPPAGQGREWLLRYAHLAGATWVVMR